ncbi:hypothetical protein BDU57DRAFT_263556 [Ampelomyces quisqualis]|uniref:Uncharacterized protein n=1 Tax=Ampelomyces quisqualis TaxID=50730 RepID=A0A6A5QHU3_AMPQU|nr:hypothetical protein BDU57DRAFT_263556 [Ampelomyces quisqualis]
MIIMYIWCFCGGAVLPSLNHGLTEAKKREKLGRVIDQRSGEVLRGITLITFMCGGLTCLDARSRPSLISDKASCTANSGVESWQENVTIVVTALEVVSGVDEYA